MMHLLERISDVLKYAEQPGNEHVLKSINLIKECLADLKDDPSLFCVSFNGGKDCTALLHLVFMVFMKNLSQDQRRNTQLIALYIRMPNTFPELESFMVGAAKRYNLNVITVDGPDYRQALAQLKNHPLGSKLKYIFMGTRATDKKWPLKAIQDTDPGWPLFTRVHPLLDWSYRQVWSFLRDNNVLYCCLYDRGYTSLGSSTNTKPNPKLQQTDEDGRVTYLPAYMLEHDSDERVTREC